MSQGKRKLPKFRSEDEEAKYWDEHCLTEHLDQFRPAEKVRFVRPIKSLVSMRYDVTLLQQIRAIAARKGVPYQTLMHQWLTERTNEELALAGRAPRYREAGTQNLILSPIIGPTRTNKFKTAPTHILRRK